VEFRLFGAVECWVAGERIYVGAAKERCLLAALLLAVGSPVSADSLIMNLWGDSPPGDADGSLRSSISHLRKYLRNTDDEVEIRSVQRTYTLIVDPDTVDVHRFRHLRAQARSIAESGDYERAVSLLREADLISAREALTGLSGDWVERMRVSLGRERHSVAVDQADALLTLGRNSDAIEYLQRLLIRDPLDEAFGERLLVALYRHGQQAEAIRLYHQIAQRLDDSLGTDPGPRLRELYRRIVAQDPTLDLAISRPLRVADHEMLPPVIDDFTGRRGEIAGLVKSASSGSHTIVIEGLPGVGKTSLAIRVAHELEDRYPDGQMFLPLQTHDPRESRLMSPDSVLLALLEKIGVPAKRIPARLDERIALWRQELAGRRIIVVLDDIDNVRQVEPAISANPRCLFLLTSRQALDDLTDADRLSLMPLSSDDATAMFATISGVAPDKHQSAVTELVQTCSGLPLAIRLTAAQMREADSAAATAVALQDELTSAQGQDEKSATSDHLDAVFDSSYRALDQPQAQAFRRLGLHPGADLGLDAARALTGLSPPAFDKVIEVLADQYLIERTEGGRLRCHDLLRRYAYRRARRDDSLGEGRQAVRRLLDYYVQTTGAADRLLYPHRLRRTSEVPRQPRANHQLAAPDEGRRWLEAEWQAVLAAIRYAADYEWPYHAIALADAIAEFISTSGRWEEAEDAYRRALRVARELQIPDAAAQLSTSKRGRKPTLTSMISMASLAA